MADQVSRAGVEAEDLAVGVAGPTFTARKLTRTERLLRQREIGILCAAVVIFVALSLLRPETFPTESNLLNIARQISFIAIIAVGMTFLFIAGELDLSVGSLVGLCVAVLMFLMARWEWNPWVAMLATIGLGAVGGLVNGLITTRFGIPSFIVTLGTLSTFRGLALLVSGGWPLTIESSDWTAATGGYILGDKVPIPVLWMAAIMLIGGFVLAKTKFGYHVYATGGNKQAAVVAGINVNRVKLVCFVLTGALCGLSASLLVAWLKQGNPLAGINWELDVIAAVIIGGTNLFGGSGSIFGTFLGAAINGMVINGLVHLGLTQFWDQVARGVIIVAAVLLDLFIRRRQER